MMRVSTRLPLVLLLVLQVILLLVAIRVGAGGAPGPRSDSPRNVDPAALPLTVESGFAAAETRASIWRPDAELMAVSMQVDWPLAVDPNAPVAVAPGGWITYTFASPIRTSPGTRDMEIGATLSLLYERRSGVLVDTQEVSWMEPMTTSPFVSFPFTVTSSTAVLTMELKQGRTWRMACPKERHVTRVSLAQVDDTIRWVVGYGDTRTGVAALGGEIDVQTGDLMNIRDRSRACDNP